MKKVCKKVRKICRCGKKVVHLQRKSSQIDNETTCTAMKKVLLTRINAIIAFLLTVLGFGSCNRNEPAEPRVAYGVPYATFEAAGKITNEQAQPVENINVRVMYPWNHWSFLEQYTDAEGEYLVSTDAYKISDSVDIVVTDTAGIYQGDSVRVKVEYDRSGVEIEDYWNEGKGLVYHDFQLKKK